MSAGAPGIVSAAAAGEPWLDIYSVGHQTFSLVGGGLPDPSKSSIVRHVALTRDGSMQVIFTSTVLEPTPGSPILHRVFHRLRGNALSALADRLDAAGIATESGGCDARRTSISGHRFTHLTATEATSWFGEDGAQRQFSVSPTAPELCSAELIRALGLLEEEVEWALNNANPPVIVCSAGSDAFAVADGRFEVHVCWHTNATSGRGKLSQRVGEGAIVWFFDPANPELLIKVKDACATPSDSYWVFLAGLTNVWVNISVRDTQTGAYRAYQNPFGVPFTPIQDTAAFGDCP